jgi:hypothetical protein
MRLRHVIAGVALVLAGCGTNAKALVARSGDLTREADWLADRAGSAEADRLYAAEAQRAAACTEVDRATMERFEDPDVAFMERFLSDLVQVAVLLVPVGPVERCAAAQARYEAAVAEARRRAGERDGALAAAPPP